MVAHTFDVSVLEAYVGVALWVWGQPIDIASCRSIKETLSRKNKTK